MTCSSSPFLSFLREEGWERGPITRPNVERKNSPNPLNAVSVKLGIDPQDFKIFNASLSGKQSIKGIAMRKFFSR